MRVRIIQIRSEDFLKQHEMECLQRTTGLQPAELESFDALQRPLSIDVLEGVDALMIGGSGEYSATQNSPLHDALVEVVRACYETRKPLLGLCFGHHMMARAMGGVVLTDEARAETGTVRVSLLPRSTPDELLQGLPSSFYVAQGHHDSVVELPPTLENLASSERSPYQAIFAPGRPFYGLQFHPELRLEDLLHRLSHYGYVATPEKRASLGDLHESPPEVQLIPRRFIDAFVRPTVTV